MVSWCLTRRWCACQNVDVSADVKLWKGGVQEILGVYRGLVLDAEVVANAAVEPARDGFDHQDAVVVRRFPLAVGAQRFLEFLDALLVWVAWVGR